jgi:hypothetical protein
MMPLSQEDRRAIEGLIVEYVWLLDQGRNADVADLYTADGRLIGGKFGVLERAGMIAMGNTSDSAFRTHHQCTNIRIEADGADQARGWVQLVLRIRAGDGPIAEEFVGEYQDRYMRDKERRWRFVERKLVPLGISSGRDTQ